MLYQSCDQLRGSEHEGTTYQKTVIRKEGKTDEAQWVIYEVNFFK